MKIMRKESEQPFFSIVIVNYNGGAYLEQAIQSIITQNCQDYELVVVDGASTDNSVDVIRNYEKYISWWVSEKDNGQSDAFNKGFSKVKGTFLFWINSDDFLLPGSLKLAKENIMQNPGRKWFSANTIFFSVDGKIEKCSVGPKWNSKLLKHNPVYVYGPTSIFHRDLLREVKGFDNELHYTMDTDLWYRFSDVGEEFVKIDRFFWAFRIHEKSKTSHAFSGKQNKQFERESEYILSKNNRKIKYTYKCMLFLYKLITGAYLKSLYYTMKYKGQSVFFVEIER